RPDNILTAIAENQRRILNATADDQRGIALACLFHLIGDIHQPLQTIHLFTREYHDGDRGGNEVCVRVRQGRAALLLHRLSDGLLTSSNNTRTLRNIAIELQSRFTRSGLSELAVVAPEAWAKESFEI